MRVFAEDWAFTTRETLKEDPWFPAIPSAGQVTARGIADGPDEDLDKLRWVILGAVARAERKVRIVTPYFLPDTTLIMSLNVAAMRGVQVDIVLPGRTNLRFIKWASDAQLWQMLIRGCRVFHTPTPFDHSKVMVVDGAWTLVGSANWDPRSFRLNFEFNVECYDVDLASKMDRFIDERIDRAQELTLEFMDRRTLPVRLRDGVVRLLKPYL